MPEIKTKPVKTTVKLPGEDKGKPRVVAIAEFPDWTKNPSEIMQPAPQGLGPEQVYALAQTQNTTNIVNNIRRQFAVGPTDSKLRERAQAELASQMKMDGSQNERDKEILGIMQDSEKFNQYLTQEVERLKVKIEQERAVKIAEAAKKFEDVKVEEEEDEEVATVSA